MGKLIYSAMTSLDGYIEDEKGEFDWAFPDAEVHAFINDLERPIGIHLYGRRMYETMAVWQTVGDEPGLPAAEADFAEPPTGTSASAAPAWRSTRSGPGWWTRSTSWCSRSSWAAASQGCPETSGWTSSVFSPPHEISRPSASMG